MDSSWLEVGGHGTAATRFELPMDLVLLESNEWWNIIHNVLLPSFTCRDVSTAVSESSLYYQVCVFLIIIM